MLKIHFFAFSHFWMTTLKKPYFYRVFWPFPFSFFFFFLFLFFQHKKGKNKKCNFLFENLIFDNPKFSKKNILTHCGTICVSKNAQKHYKTGEKTAKKKLGPVFNFKLGPVFNFKTPKSWTSFLTLQHIYIYIFIYLFIYMYVCCEVWFWTNLGGFES